MKLSAEYSDRMMAQHVGRSRFTPATVLLLLVPACVAQLANANATTTIDGVRYDDTSSRVVVQPTVKSAPVIRTAVALSHGAADDRRPLVEFLGTGLGRDLTLRWSSSRHDCPMTYSDDTLLDAVWTSPTRDRAIYEFRTSITEDPTIAVVYFCLRNGSDDDDGGDGRRWRNLGDRVSIEFPVRPE